MNDGIWYNIQESYEQCESGHGKIFVVLAHKKIFPCPDS